PTRGDDIPQVLLIPSWGMTIQEAPVYAANGALVFNVDGRAQDRHHPAAIVFGGKLRCPDHGHADEVASPALSCPKDHFVCRKHKHRQSGTNCSRCNATLRTHKCTVKHWFGTDWCQFCGADPLPRDKFWCEACKKREDGATCASCSQPTVDGYRCD